MMMEIHRMRTLRRALAAWKLRHIEWKVKKMKSAKAVHHWALYLEYKALQVLQTLSCWLTHSKKWKQFHQTKKERKRLKLEAKKMYQTRLIKWGLVLLLTVMYLPSGITFQAGLKLREERLQQAEDREAERARKVFRRVYKYAMHWRAVTLKNKLKRKEHQQGRYDMNTSLILN